MPDSPWKDPLVVEPTDGVTYWVRVLSWHRAPVQMTYHGPHHEFEFPDAHPIVVPVYQVFGYRPL